MSMAKTNLEGLFVLENRQMLWHNSNSIAVKAQIVIMTSEVFWTILVIDLLL